MKEKLFIPLCDHIFWCSNGINYLFQAHISFFKMVTVSGTFVIEPVTHTLNCRWLMIDCKLLWAWSLRMMNGEQKVTCVFALWKWSSCRTKEVTLISIIFMVLEAHMIKELAEGTTEFLLWIVRYLDAWGKWGWDWPKPLAVWVSLNTISSIFIRSSNTQRGMLNYVMNLKCHTSENIILFWCHIHGYNLRRIFSKAFIFLQISLKENRPQCVFIVILWQDTKYDEILTPFKLLWPLLHLVLKCNLNISLIDLWADFMSQMCPRCKHCIYTWQRSNHNASI